MIRVGIIGCGGQGRIHANAYARIEGVQIVGCCDVLPERAQELAQPFGATAFTDHREMLAQTRPDLVSVCTLEGHHAQHTIDSLRAGAHVLYENWTVLQSQPSARMNSHTANSASSSVTPYSSNTVWRWLKPHANSW